MNSKLSICCSNFGADALALPQRCVVLGILAGVITGTPVNYMTTAKPAPFLRPQEWQESVTARADMSAEAR